MRKKFVRCPICRRQFSLFRKLEGYFYCSYCGLVRLKKFPKAIYGNDYYKGQSGVASRLFSPLAAIFHKIRESYVGFNKKTLWIDVGAGEGSFIRTVFAKNKLGVEVSKAGRRLMEKNGIKTMTEKKFLHSNLLQADVISFWHVLEHLERPWKYLVSARKNLAKNGKLVVGIPNFDSFDFMLFGKDWFHLAPEFHFWHFSPKSMRLLLRKTGFTVEHVDYLSPEHYPAGLLQSFINKTSGSNNALHRAIKRGGGPFFTIKDAFWSIFWMTIGLPIILGICIIGSVCHRSGTIVVVAKRRI